MSDIKIENVKKNYGKTPVVHGVDLAIKPGEFVVILGPSGCGKSTLLRMIAGLEAITEGTISIGGRVVNELEPRERGCAMVFQNYALYPHFSVADNIGYALKVAGVRKAERLKKIAEVAKVVGLEDYLDRKPSQLSGGQRQRVAMGRAMIREPKVFLFDEPLSNLDARLRVQMRLEIRRLHQRLGTTSIFVTHDQVEAMTLADRIVVMNAGRIEQIGTPSEVYEQPRSRFVAGFIGSPPMNLVEGTVATSTSIEVAGIAVETKSVAGLNAASRIVLGVRPEEAIVRADGRYGLMTTFVEKLGPVQLAHGTFGATDFSIQCPAGLAIDVGQTLRFDMPASAIHVFDPTSSLRVG